MPTRFPRARFAALSVVLLAALSCGGKVVVDPTPTGSGGTTATGGAGSCDPVSGICNAYCDSCENLDGTSCYADCLTHHLIASPACADTHTAMVACWVAQQPIVCGGGAACGAEFQAWNACIAANVDCTSWGCQACSCSTSCTPVFKSSFADGIHTCTIDGEVVGTCADACAMQAIAPCCATLFMNLCPL